MKTLELERRLQDLAHSITESELIPHSMNLAKKLGEEYDVGPQDHFKRREYLFDDNNGLKIRYRKSTIYNGEEEIGIAYRGVKVFHAMQKCCPQGEDSLLVNILGVDIVGARFNVLTYLPGEWQGKVESLHEQLSGIINSVEYDGKKYHLFNENPEVPEAVLEVLRSRFGVF